jgi:hypothetical protein
VSVYNRCNIIVLEECRSIDDLSLPNSQRLGKMIQKCNNSRKYASLSSFCIILISVKCKLHNRLGFVCTLGQDFFTRGYNVHAFHKARLTLDVKKSRLLLWKWFKTLRKLKQVIIVTMFNVWDELIQIIVLTLITYTMNLNCLKYYNINTVEDNERVFHFDMITLKIDCLISRNHPHINDAIFQFIALYNTLVRFWTERFLIYLRMWINLRTFIEICSWIWIKWFAFNYSKYVAFGFSLLWSPINNISLDNFNIFTGVLNY